MIDMCGLRVILVIQVTILTSSNTCYNSSLEKKEWLFVHTTMRYRNLHYMNRIAVMDLLIIDWATLPCKLLIALPNIFFFLPEDKSLVCFMWLSIVKSSANRLWIRSKQLYLQGSSKRSSEKLFFLLNYKHTTCKPLDAIWGQLCKT